MAETTHTQADDGTDLTVTQERGDVATTWQWQAGGLTFTVTQNAEQSFQWQVKCDELIVGRGYTELFSTATIYANYSATEFLHQQLQRVDMATHAILRSVLG